MKKLIAIASMACCLMTLQNVQGQTKVTKKEFESNADVSNIVYFISPTSAISWGNKKYNGDQEIEFIDDLKITSKLVFNYKFEGGHVNFIERKVIDGRLMILFCATDDFKRSYYITYLNKETRQLEKSAIKLFSHPVEKNKIVPDLELYFAHSLNEKRFTIAFPDVKDNVKELKGWYNRVYSIDFQLVKEDYLPAETFDHTGAAKLLRNGFVDQYGITNSGIVYWVHVNTFLNNCKFSYCQEIKQATIFRLDRGQIKSDEFDVKGYAYEGMKYFVSEDQKLYMTGGAISSDKLGYKGLFSLVYDLVNAKMISNKSIALPSEIIKKENELKQKSRVKSKELDPNALFNYRLCDLKVDKEGNQYFIYEKRVLVIGAAWKYYAYNFLVCKIDVKGNLDYTKVIPKSIQSVDESLLDSYIVLQDKELIILMKDKANHYDKAGNFAPKNGEISNSLEQVSILAQVRMNLDDGSFSRARLPMIGVFETFTRVKNIQHALNTNQYYYYFFKSSKPYLVNIQF
jgi:hypothetical protein